MKVAYLVNQYPHVSHTFIRREIAALEARGIKVERFSVRPPPKELVDPADLAEVAKTTVLLASKIALLSALVGVMITKTGAFLSALKVAWRLGGRSERGRFVHLIYLAEAALLLNLLRQRSATHVHAHFGTNPPAVALLCRTLGGPPYSFTVHGPEEFDHPAALSLGDKIHSAAFVAAISEFGRSQLFRWCEQPDWDKIAVVRCGLDPNYAGATGTPPAAPRFVCVGRLCEQKGQLLLVDAAARLRDEVPALEIRLVGDGPMRPLIESRIRELGVESQVGILGWMSNAAVREELVAARALVLPSFAEGLPVVIMEALAAGRPAIATYVAGIPELVRPGENGWLAPAGSIDGLVAVLREAATTPVERLIDMGRRGADAVRLRHNVNHEAGLLADRFIQSAKL